MPHAAHPIRAIPKVPMRNAQPSQRIVQTIPASGDEAHILLSTSVYQICYLACTALFAIQYEPCPCRRGEPFAVMVTALPGKARRQQPTETYPGHLGTETPWARPVGTSVCMYNIHPQTLVRLAGGLVVRCGVRGPRSKGRVDCGIGIFLRTSYYVVSGQRPRLTQL